MPTSQQVEGSVPHSVSYEPTQTNNQPALHVITAPDAFSDSKVSESIRNDQMGDVKNEEVYKLNDVNAVFNAKLGELTEANAQSMVLSLGIPNALLQSAGVEAKEMKLYGNKVMKKMRKHGFTLDELRNLPEAVANPIAVFDNLNREGNRSILTELKTRQGNFLVSIDLGKGVTEVEFNIVSSVFGKGKDKVISWLNKGYATYINKEKALNYLCIPAPIAGASNSQELSSIAKLIENFENPSIDAEKNAGSDVIYMISDE